MDEEIEPLEEPTECPACGSANLHRRPRLVYFAVIALIAIGWGVAAEATEAMFFAIAAAAIFTMVIDRWLCTDCGASWK